MVTSNYTIDTDTINPTERVRVLRDGLFAGGCHPDVAPLMIAMLEAYDAAYAAASEGLALYQAHQAATKAPSYLAAFETYRAERARVEATT